MPRRTKTPSIESRKLTVAFVGDAPVKTALVEELLDDFFRFGPKDEETGWPAPSDDDIEVILPISRDWTTDAVGEVLGWTGYADLPYTAITDGDVSAALEKDLKEAKDKVESDNIHNAILNVLEEAHDEGRESILVFAWGPDDHKRDERYDNLLDDANNSDRIDRVLDLTAGMDDLSFNDDDAAAEPEKEPEPEPDPEPAPARRRRAPAAKEEDPEPPSTRRRHTPAEKPLEEPEKPLTEEKAPARRRSTSKTPDEVKAAGDEALEGVRTARAKVTAAEGKESTQPAADNAFAIEIAKRLLEYFEAAETVRRLSSPGVLVQESGLTAQSRALVAFLSGEEPARDTPGASRPKRGGGRPRADGTPAQPRSPEDLAESYIVEDGRYRKAGVGRKPRGQVRELLTEIQVASLRAEGLVDDE